MRVMKFLLMAVLFVAAFFTPQPILAQSPFVDFSQKASLKLTVKDTDGKSVGGGRLEIFKVADLALDDDGNLFWQVDEAFEGASADLSDPQNPQLVNYLEDYVSRQSLSGITSSISEEGTAQFDGLDLGLYLVRQTRPASGYQKMSSFLIDVPAIEDETVNYQVEAFPKAAVNPRDLPTAPDTENTPKAPDTGASSSIRLYISLLLIALATLGGILLNEKRRNENS